MTITAPPRPPRPSDPVTHGEFDALVEALIEEARQRARRRRRIYMAVATSLALVAVVTFTVLERAAQSQNPSSPLSARSSLAAGAASSQIAFVTGPPPWGGGYCGSVYVMNADGSGQRRLTNDGIPGCGQEAAPAWSPDGRRIAFVRGLPGGFRDPSIYVMNAGGSGLQRLTRNTGILPPVWSPDGRMIAFPGGLLLMSPDGSWERRQARIGRSPAWSPDGRRIAFVGGVTRGRHNMEIHVVSTDGSGHRRLTRNTVQDGNPVWSPDGRRIAFVSDRHVWVMNADGSGQRRLTRAGARYAAPTWSPDGRRIAFERRLGEPCHNRCTGAREPRVQLWVMDADGSAQRMLTRRGEQPVWSPEGRKIAFVSKRDGDPDIYVMNADGSGQRNLTRTRESESSPVWSPAQR